MTKAIINSGYRDLVVDLEDAVTFHTILSKAERYERVYRDQNEGGPLYYIWEQDTDDEHRNLQIISDNFYRLAKLAGKPPKK